MPLPTLNKTMQRRAITQASANIESHRATVTRTYADALGNITAVDVKVVGQTNSLVSIPNASGLKLYVGAAVEMRNVNGNIHARQVVGIVGGSTAAAMNAGASDPAPLNMASYLAGNAPVLLQSADAADNPNGYVEVPGANVSFLDTPPATASGGAAVNGQRLLSVTPLVTTSLPNPQATTLPSGTLLDLVDSYGNPLGMYRLDAGAGMWRRRDAGGGSGFILPASSSGFGTVETDITESGGSVVYTKTTADSLFATGASLTTEATARQNADTAEATARQKADTAEASARASGDTLAAQKSANLSDLASASAARTNLSLGTAATRDAPASGNASASQVVLGSDTRLGSTAASLTVKDTGSFEADNVTQIIFPAGTLTLVGAGIVQYLPGGSTGGSGSTGSKNKNNPSGYAVGVARWLCNVTSGTTLADSVTSPANDLTITASGYLGQDSFGDFFSPARAAKAYGVGNNGLLTGQGDFSCEYYTLTGAEVTDTRFLGGHGYGPGGGNNQNIVFEAGLASGTWIFLLGVGGSEVRLNGSAAAANSLYHVVMTYVAASGAMSIYVNGALSGSSTGNGTRNAPVSGAANYLGDRVIDNATTTYAWDGKIYFGSIYARALPLAEIQARYSAIG